MSYTNAKGEFQDTQDVSPLPATTYTSAGAKNGASIEVGSRTVACLELVCTSLTASDTLDAKLQTSKDGTGSGLGAWRDVGSFTQITTTSGSERKSFAGLDRFIRAVVTPTDAGGGGISVTLSIKGELK